MTPERWRYTSEYLREVFGQEDDVLTRLVREASERGLPDISIGPEVGRLLTILVSMTRAKLVLELGTLGGYSAIWMARALTPGGPGASGGRLITIESDAAHADFAEDQFRRAGLADRIELVRGAALDVLPGLARRLGEASLDAAFFDAIKAEYPDYWSIVRPLIAPGGLILADNALGSDWWIDECGGASREGVDRFNRAVASDPEFESVAIPLRQGLLIGRRMLEVARPSRP